jgi:cytochrome c oxidase cbb3-type subunit 1
MRPLHTSAVIFAFGGNALMATSFYVVQRTSRARLFGRQPRLVRVLGLPAVHRHGGNRLPPGRHPGPEYAEPEWYVDLWLTIVWVAYLMSSWARS